MIYIDFEIVLLIKLKKKKVVINVSGIFMSHKTSPNLNAHAKICHSNIKKKKISFGLLDRMNRKHKTYI